MEYLDSKDSVTSWEYEPYQIAYLSNRTTMKIRKYYPDLYVEYNNRQSELIEIKPSSRLKNQIVQKKALAATRWCEDKNMTYKFVTEKDLKLLGLI